MTVLDETRPPFAIRDVAVCMPVFNDWVSAAQVIVRVSEDLATRGLSVCFLVVDDGSTEAPPPGFLLSGAGAPVEVVRLRRNAGHQRAIAVGLALLEQRSGFDAVAVMDSDGEDRPEDTGRLLDALAAQQGASIVFAKRTRRSEGMGFRVAYRVFRLIHRILTGRRVEIGNFSAMSTASLHSVVALPEIWVHYAAGVTRSRHPLFLVPLPRGRRIAGQSRMNWIALVGHALGALSIFGEEIVVRILAGCLAMIAIATAVGVGAAAGVFEGLASLALGAGLIAFSIAAQGVLASIVLYRLKSMHLAMPFGDAARWLATSTD